MSVNDMLEQKFYVRVALWLTLLAVVGAVPFAVYRLYVGDFLVAGLTFGIVGTQSVVAFYLLRGGSGLLGIHLMAVTYSIGCAAVALLTPGIGHYWLFPVVVANFYMLPQNSAVVLNLAVLATGTSVLFWDPQVGSRFVVTLAMVGLFGFIFARQVRNQKDVLNQMALVDVLTGAANRRALDAELQQITEEQRYGARATVIMFDLDGFKAINDRFGHGVGDAVICQVANLVRERIRTSDQLYRFGGEEFVIVSRHQGVDAGAGLAENLRALLEAENHPGVGTVTASFGVAEWHKGERREDWLSRADRMLYEAKEHGRNQVRVDRDPDPVLGDKVRYLHVDHRTRTPPERPQAGRD